MLIRHGRPDIRVPHGVHDHGNVAGPLQQVRAEAVGRRSTGPGSSAVLPFFRPLTHCSFPTPPVMCLPVCREGNTQLPSYHELQNCRAIARESGAAMSEYQKNRSDYDDHRSKKE
jgi:hypothetical protein